MQSTHENNSASAFLDYDLISLSNALAYSFEEGLLLASSMLNAPFFMTNLYDYVIIRSQTIKVDDAIWDQISKTNFYSSDAAASNKNIYSVTIPLVGKMVYYSVSEPTDRQKQLASYVAWMVYQFSKERFYVSNPRSSPKSAFLFYLLNEQYDLIDGYTNDSLTKDLPQKMQVLSTFYNPAANRCADEISKLCGNTEYVTVHKQKYIIFMFPCLSAEQTNALSEMLSQCGIYAGLSYPFRRYKDCRNHALQAIAALNENVKRGRKYHLAQYENLFALDVLYNYSSNVPLSAFRHPLFSRLEEYDKSNNTELYITLMAYIENSGNTGAASKQLSAHRNTVSYRLRQITEITGYDVQNPVYRAALLYPIIVENASKHHSR